MKVILKQDVKSLGKKNSMVNVSDGYAKNFLLPKGLAVEANSSSINELNTKAAAEKKRKADELNNAKELAEKINSIKVTLKAKSGDNGKLFGSITSKDIVDALKKDFNIKVDKRKLVLKEALKTVGQKEIEIKLYPKVTATLKVIIENE